MSANFLAANLLPPGPRQGLAPQPRAERDAQQDGGFKDFLDLQRVSARSLKASDKAGDRDRGPVDGTQEDEETVDAALVPTEAPATQPEVSGPIPAPVLPVPRQGEATPVLDIDLPTLGSDEPIVCSEGKPVEHAPKTLSRSVADVFIRSDNLGLSIGRVIGAQGLTSTSDPGITISPSQQPAAQGEIAVVPEAAQAAIARSDTQTTSVNAGQPSTSFTAPPPGGVVDKNDVVNVTSPDADPSRPEQNAGAQAGAVNSVKQDRVSRDPRVKADPRLASTDGQPSESGEANPALQQAVSRVARPAADAPALRVGILSGEGDAAAASIGRFLVIADTESIESTGNSLPRIDSGSVSSTATLARPTSAPASTSNSFQSTIGQLLSPPVAAGDVVEAAARVLTASGQGGRQQVTLQLDPPELGHLRLEIRMHQQAMTLRVDAQTHEVARLIESRMSELRDALASHGIRVDRSEVVVKPAPTAESNTQQQDGGHQRQSSHDDARQDSQRGSPFGQERPATSRGDDAPARDGGAGGAHDPLEDGIGGSTARGAMSETLIIDAEGLNLVA